MEKTLISRIHGAGEHEILPDQNAMLITQVIEYLCFIYTPTPDAQHVHIGLHSGTNLMQITIRSDLRYEAVVRNVVSAFAEDRDSVQLQIKARSCLIPLANQTNGSESRAHLMIAQQLGTLLQCCPESM
ncbi:hypothetical protein D1872_255130 [compost metagenome]